MYKERCLQNVYTASDWTLIYCKCNVIHLMSDPEGNSFVSRENKTNWFPEGPDIKCFVVFLDFHFNSNKRITEANQNSRLSTYSNTNLILNTTLQSTFLIIITCIFFLHQQLFLFWDDFKNRCFLNSLRLHVCVQVVVFIHEKENWQCFSHLMSHHFPPCFDDML